MTIRVILGDAIERLRELPADSVHCVVTSPPYWGLRDYGVEGQIGLEPTPEAWAARLVEVFREVRRVLRPDGVCFVNVGDSYASTSTYNAARTSGGEFGRVNGERQPNAGTPAGIKPKDLIMQPALLAQALRAPYYTGTINREVDRAWLAAMIDGEGCIYIQRKKIGGKTGLPDRNGERDLRKTESFSPGVRVCNTNEALIVRCHEIAKRGRIRRAEKIGKSNRRPYWEWNLHSDEARDVLREIYPCLVAKAHEARIVCGFPSSGEGASDAWTALMALHAGNVPDLDFPAPASMFEPGWWLRSEIIWAKPNPMPESVTDRPTKAHEQIFLLTKSARYFYDAEAVREGVTGNAHARRADGDFAPAKGADANDGRAGTWRYSYEPSARNARSVWQIATEPFPEAHFATFPTELARRCILAGTSAKGCCPECGAPWARVVERGDPLNVSRQRNVGGRVDGFTRPGGGQKEWDQYVAPTTTGWRPTCTCPAAEPIPCTVLDPFGGSGTTGIVADELGRDAILIELSPDYAAMPARRLAKHMAKLEKIRRKAARELSRRYLGAGVKHIPPLPGQLDMLA